MNCGFQIDRLINSINPWIIDLIWILPNLKKKKKILLVISCFEVILILDDTLLDFIYGSTKIFISKEEEKTLMDETPM